MADGDGRWARGIAAYSSQLGVAEEDVFVHLRDLLGEPMATEAVNAAGAAWAPDSPLSLRERSLVVLTALAVQGAVEERMRPHVRWAIAHGATAEELDALGALLAVYAGFPRASIAMEVIRNELERLQ